MGFSTSSMAATHLGRRNNHTGFPEVLSQYVTYTLVSSSIYTAQLWPYSLSSSISHFQPTKASLQLPSNFQDFGHYVRICRHLHRPRRRRPRRPRRPLGAPGPLQRTRRRLLQLAHIQLPAGSRRPLCAGQRHGRRARACGQRVGRPLVAQGDPPERHGRLQRLAAQRRRAHPAAELDDPGPGRQRHARRRGLHRRVRGDQQRLRERGCGPDALLRCVRR